MIVEGRIVARVLSEPVVLVASPRRHRVLRVPVPNLGLYRRLSPGESFCLEIEDGVVIGCRELEAG